MSAAVYNNTAACLFGMTHRKMRINSIFHSSNKQNITKRFLVSFMRGMNNVFGLNDSTCSMRKIQFCHAFELNSICKYVLFDVDNLNNTRSLEALWLYSKKCTFFKKISRLWFVCNYRSESHVSATILN